MRLEYNFRRLRIFLTVSLLVLITTNCADKNNVVPNVYVNFYVNLADPDFSTLNSPGNSVFVSGGVNGIVIYNINSEEFAAYDRTCTNNVEDNCSVTLDETGVFVVDTMCCHSEYFLLDGSVSKGPATYPLKRYRTYYDPALTTLHVYN